MALLTDPLTAFPDHAPKRIVSLIPSLTGSLFDLGLSQTLVGVTDYCSYPQELTAALPKVGGPKNPRIRDILQLKPDLVLANREENTQSTVEALMQAGIPVWVSFPLTVPAALDDLWALARLMRSETAAERIRSLETALEWAARAAESMPPVRYFCPIWEDHLETGERWWMTFNENTYSNDVLRLFNGCNVFASRSRRYPFLADLGLAPPEDPGQRDTRYPRLPIQEIVLAQPDLILLPDEPYLYDEQHTADIAQVFSNTPAGQSGRVRVIDGTLLHWYGTRLARAITELPAILHDPLL